MPHTTAVVGRQSIVDRDGALVGYELLFRPLPTSQTAYDPAAGSAISGDEMTNQTIFGALGIGISTITGGRDVFCNADRGVLTGAVPVSLPPKQTVIEVLETVTIDDDVLAGCRALRAAGYRLAADDFVYFSGADALLDLVDIVKIDVQAVPLGQVPALMERCRPFGVTFVAEKIETAGELAACREMGFELFQGYHLGRPQTISGPAAAPSHAAVLQLATAVLTDDADLVAIERILRTAPELAYQLLQLAAVGRFGETRRHVDGIRQALVLIGLNRLRGWIPALLLRPSGRAVDTNLPAVLARARMIELLAGRLYPGRSDLGFTAGMLSALHLLIGVPASRLPGLLEIPDPLHRATFDRADPIGQLVGWAIDYQESGTTAEGSANPHAEVLARAAADAFAWATHSTELIDSRAGV